MFRFRAALLLPPLLLPIDGCAPPIAPKSAPAACSSAVTPKAVEPAHRVVLISIDGLKPEYLAEADARGLKIPALRELMKTGQAKVFKQVLDRQAKRADEPVAGRKRGARTGPEAPER